MIKQVTQFKSIIQGVENTFHFDPSCPIAIAKEAVLEALKWLGQIEDQIKAQQEAQAKEDAEKLAQAPTEQPKEETNVEPAI